MRYQDRVQSTPSAQPRLWALIVQISVAWLVILWTVTPAFGAERKTVFPIFFATDRVLDHSKSGLAYTSEQEPDKLAYGVKNIVLEGNGGENELAERIQGLGWWQLVDPKDPSPPTKTSTLTEAELLDQVKTVAESGPADRPVVVYVHGCCSDFNKTTTDGARLARSIAAPVVVYAWTAIPPLTAYKKNEPNQANSAKRFEDFMQSLEGRIGAERIVLVGYSMGNRFLQESLTHRWNDGKNGSLPKFRAACFMCADVDTFKFASTNRGVASCSKETLVSKNDADGALAASNLVHGVPPLGAPKQNFKKIRGADGLMFYDILPILGWNHHLPIELLAQILRDRAQHGSPYDLRQEAKDLTRVSAGDKKTVHATIVDQ